MGRGSRESGALELGGKKGKKRQIKEGGNRKKREDNVTDGRLD